MPLHVDNDPGTRAVRSLVISCDAEACVATINDREAAKAGGLTEAGWHRRFNSETRRNEYFCPQHKEQVSGN